MENHIHCETTGNFVGYIDLVKMDEPVWKNSMCNGIVRLSQGWKTHAGTDTIEFILHIDKPKDIRATYVRAVCDIIPPRKETYTTRITVGVNLVYYPV